MDLSFDLQPGDDRLFTDESLEQIENIESGLLQLERGVADNTVVNEVFRAAHTLKGSAATIGHKRMAELTHAMEDIFGALRGGELTEIGPFADVLLSTIDVLRALVEEVSVGQVLTDAPEELTRRLRELLDQAMLGPADAGSAGAGGDGATNPLPAMVAGLLANKPSGLDSLTIATCAVDPACEWQAVRLLQAVMEARESGRFVASAPSLVEIENGQAGRHLAVLLMGTPDELAETGQRMAEIDDIVDVVVQDPEGMAVEDTGAVSAAELAPETTGATDGSGRWPNGERRQADLGPESRGIPAEERTAVAGERLKIAQQTIRIDVSRLDELMNLVGELVVHKTRLQLQAQQMMLRLGDEPIARDAEEGAQQFSRIASQLQDQVTGLRMLPIETVFNRFPRVVRDVAAKLGKEVRLDIDGKETELDRSVLEEVGDPLGHLVRNALDHGIEPPDERRAAGKPAEGRLRLSARHAEGQIVITVEDDGKGMDPAELRLSAVSKGLLSAEAAAALPDADALKLIFMPGFSTAVRITDVSGRGVGMDVVRTNIERLGGRVDVSSTAGIGTQVSLSLPLTLAIVGAMLVRSRDRVSALPLTGVVETLRVQHSSVSTIHGHPVILLRGRVVPIEVLDNALGDPVRPLEPGPRGFINMVVVRSRDELMALTVDEFVGEQEIVLKSMSTFTGRLNGIAGATILADGSVALVVDIGALIEYQTRRRREHRPVGEGSPSGSGSAAGTSSAAGRSSKRRRRATSEAAAA